jgi:hypothetical protein
MARRTRALDFQLLHAVECVTAGGGGGIADGNRRIQLAGARVDSAGSCYFAVVSFEFARILVCLFQIVAW